jgi:hypothetical protein
MVDPELARVDEIWVNVTEATQLTGYSRIHMLRLATQNWRLPENERLFRLRKRSNGYEIWLPDLMDYIANHGHGPHKNPL